LSFLAEFRKASTSSFFLSFLFLISCAFISFSLVYAEKPLRQVEIGSKLLEVTPSWSKWQLKDSGMDVQGPESYRAWSPAGPISALEPLDTYKTSPHENPATIALKIDDMIAGLSPAIINAASHDLTQEDLPQTMMRMADTLTEKTDRMYADMNGMYGEIEGMKTQLKRNYDTYNASEQTPELARKFNTQSDAMADRTGGMQMAVQGMKDFVQLDQGLLHGMFDVLDEMGQNGREAVEYFDRLTKHVQDVSGRFEAMAGDLKRQGVEGTQTVERTRQYLSNLREYVKGNKSHASHQLDYLKQVDLYLQNTQKYFGDVLKDFKNTEADLKETEDYFRKSKIDAGTGREIVSVSEAAGHDVCVAAKTEDLSTLQDCAKDCRRVCRWKEEVGGVDCYECPSGSPDSCWDVGAWPADHPWCAPGGVCHSDPMLYCEPFGTWGPNKEFLQCTHCKQRPDLCWQKVGDDTMTLTNCRLGCWDGKCVYKGKYKETEWDGTPEFIHCYKCQRPPPPPSCEDLKWGYTWYSDCKADCPDPGDCEKVAKNVPGAPKPPQPPGPPGAPPGGGQDQPQGGQQGGQQEGQPGEGADQGKEGGTSQGGQPPSGTDGKKADPPGGTPAQPGTGAGAVAGPDAKPDEGAKGTDSSKGDEETQQPPQAPPTTAPTQPPEPTDEKPKPPENPPKPPDNPEISFYRKWLEETQERAQSREDIIADPNEGEYTKEEAQRQLESMTREKEYLEKRVGEEEQKELERQQKEAEAKKRQEEYERTRPRARDYAAEMRHTEQEYKLKKLKEATDALKDKLQEAKDVFEGRRQRLETINREIDQLEAEIKQFNDEVAQGRMDEDDAEAKTRERQKRINELKDMRNQFAKRLRELERQYREEIEKLRADYQRRLWSVNESSRRRAEVVRIDEYYQKYSELKDREQTNAIRNETFESIVRGLEEDLKKAEAGGDSDRADELRTQIENLKRGQAEWQEAMDRQISRLKDDLWELEYRNGYEGAGPSSPESLAKQLGEYEGLIQNEITSAEKTIADLEKAGTTRTREQNQQLQDLKARVNNLRSAVDDLRAKKETVLKPAPFSEEDRQRVIQSTAMVANGMMNRDADKSMVRLFAESLGEEYVHNLNPLVMAKKSVAFTWGVAQGVGSAVKGLAELGWEALDTIGEGVAVDLGFEEGGIFGTENLDTINNALTGIGSNANFDGLIKLVVAGGKAIDDKLTELQRSGDIDWATAEFGGKVAGDVVVADAVIAGAVGKAGTLMRGADEAADLGRAAGKVDDVATAGTKIDDATRARAGTKIDDAARAGTAGSPLDDTQRFPPFEPPGLAVDDVAGTGRTPVTKVDDVPGSSPRDAPSSRGPPEAPKTPEAPTTPPRGGIGPNSQATVITPDGRQVTLKTGEELGHGSTSTVYADATDPKKAIRITEPGRGGIESAPALDRAGRQAVESIQRPNGPLRIAEKGEPFTVTDPNSPLNGKIVEVVERVENGSADKFLKSQGGGRMTEGQAQAFADATHELNKNGFAWMDNHTGNYGFEKIPGTEDGWRVVVLDPGGIVPMKGSNLAEKAANASALQRRLNVSEEGMADFLNSASPGLKQNLAKVERGVIFEEFGDTIDAAAMGLDSPHDIAFYPFGTTEFPEVQRLFR